MKSANRFFWHALGTVFRNPGLALRVIWLPFLISIAIYEIDSRVNPYSSGILLSVFDFMLFSWAAIAWHRAMLMNEYPAFWGGRHTKPLVRYAVFWFFIGLVASIVGLAALVAVMYPVIISMFDAQMSSWQEYVPEILLDLSKFSGLALYSQIAVFLAIWAGISAFFGLASGLPAIATGRYAQWRNADPSSGSFTRSVAAGFWCAVFWIGVLWINSALYGFEESVLLATSSDPGDQWVYSGIFAANNLLYAFNVLVGAAVLTEAARYRGLAEEGDTEGRAPD